MSLELTKLSGHWTSGICVTLFLRHEQMPSFSGGRWGSKRPASQMGTRDPNNPASYTGTGDPNLGLHAHGNHKITTHPTGFRISYDLAVRLIVVLTMYSEFSHTVLYLCKQHNSCSRSLLNFLYIVKFCTKN